MSNRWSNDELSYLRKLDLEIAQMVSLFEGGYWHQNKLFIPTANNIAELKDSISRKMVEVSALSDGFWRNHFTQVLESFEYSIDLELKLPYNFVGRPSTAFDQLTAEDPRSSSERAWLIHGKMSDLPGVLAALKPIVAASSDLGRSTVSQALKPFVKNVDRAVQYVLLYGTEGMKSDIQRDAEEAKKLAAEISAMVKFIPLATLPTVDIPFEYALEKGMQVPKEYILSWVEDDVQYRREQFFKTAADIDPKRDAYDLLNNGSPGYSSADEMFKDVRRIIDAAREGALHFVNLPEGEFCDMAPTPDVWKAVCPTAMYTGAPSHLRLLRGTMCLNDENLGAFRRASIEETTAHEVYPGHHTHGVKSQTFRHPYTFGLHLWMTRSLIEGLAHRSEYLLIPYYKDPIARLEAARRGWYCSSRVKAEVDLYYHRKPAQAIVDNYIRNLNCTEYSAIGQVQAHMMRPTDAVSYYTGMRVLEDLYRKLGIDQKQFTDETFNYGNVSLRTIQEIFELPVEKREQLKAFREE